MRAQSMAERNSMQGTRYDRTRDGGRAGPLQVALLVPCHNEAATVAAVVAGFRASLPAADCHVFDNRSDDGTGAIARATGAQVHAVALRGKGNVVRRAFADIEADVYVMVDGDATYDAAAAPGGQWPGGARAPGMSAQRRVRKVRVSPSGKRLRIAMP